MLYANAYYFLDEEHFLIKKLCLHYQSGIYVIMRFYLFLKEARIWINNILRCTNFHFNDTMLVAPLADYLLTFPWTWSFSSIKNQQHTRSYSNIELFGRSVTDHHTSQYVQLHTTAQHTIALTYKFNFDWAFLFAAALPYV